MENLEFTDDEIREQLEALGYFDVSQTRLRQFRRDLQRLVDHDRSSGSSSWFTEITSPSTNSDASPSSQHHLVTKPTLSRYQPHVKVSPRVPLPPRLSPRKPRDPPTPRDNDMSTDTSPTTRIKTLAADYPSSRPEGAEPTSAWRWQEIDTGADRVDDDVGRTAMLLGRYDDQSSEEREAESPRRRRENVGDSTTGDFAPDEPSTSYRHDDTPTTRMSPTPQLSSDSRRIIRRRKVMRKQTDGSSAVFDESLVADSDNGHSFRMHDVSIDDMNVQYNRVHLPPTLPPRPQTARPSWKRSPDQESVQDHPLPSYIRPNTSHPHTRNLRKSDPVNRYHQYKDVWNCNKAPGEKSHSGLRWEVRAQMMYKDEPHAKPQRTFVPNTYVVPTSKKRMALRWEVRHALERGLPVPSTFTVI